MRPWPPRPARCRISLLQSSCASGGPSCLRSPATQGSQARSVQPYPLIELFSDFRYAGLQVAERISRGAVDADLEVEVVAEAVPRAADVADHVALRSAPRGNREGRLMGVTGLQATAVVQAGEVAVAATFRFGLRKHHSAGGRGADRRPGGHGDVDGLVHLPPAHADAGDDRAGDRPDELTGAVADGAGRERRRRGFAERGRELGLDLRDGALEIAGDAVDLFQGRLTGTAHRHQLRLALLNRGAGTGQRLLFGGDRVAGGFDPQLRRAQAGDGFLHLVTQIADPGDDRFVEPVDAVEVLGAVDQLVVDRKSTRLNSSHTDI